MLFLIFLAIGIALICPVAHFVRRAGVAYRLDEHVATGTARQG
ncbi:hypothetical protein [Streptomyces gilvosporeus]|nr:hypothetical protein [Streptomyces gilvosporeus]